MGEERVKLADSQEEVQRFMKYVLKDIRALKKDAEGRRLV